MAKYYYFDNDETIKKYKDKTDFIKGLFWNREISRQYGDKVVSEKDLLDIFYKREACVEINGACFIKTSRNIRDYLEENIL